MRYALLGDIHANIEALESVIAACQSESIDRYYCTGDIVGYATNPKECISRLIGLNAVIVAGNHDWGSVNLFPLSFFNSVACEGIFYTKRVINESDKEFLESLKLVQQNEDFTIVHGTLDNPQDFEYMTNGYAAWETFRVLKTKVCFLGHTHIPGIFTRDPKDNVGYREDDTVEISQDCSYIINIGSVGQPRDGKAEACFAIYDTNESHVYFKRVSYDAYTTRNKIIEAGLPRSLGDRLLMGR